MLLLGSRHSTRPCLPGLPNKTEKSLFLRSRRYKSQMGSPGAPLFVCLLLHTFDGAAKHSLPSPPAFPVRTSDVIDRRMYETTSSTAQEHGCRFKAVRTLILFPSLPLAYIALMVITGCTFKALQ